MVELDTGAVATRRPCDDHRVATAREPRGPFLLKAAFLAAGIAALVAVAVIWNLNRDDGRIVSTASAEPSSFASHAEVSWGPLAVEGPPEANMDAAINGRLSITEACVLLIAPPDDEILLVWPSDQTIWDDRGCPGRC